MPSKHTNPYVSFWTHSPLRPSSNPWDVMPCSEGDLLISLCLVDESAEFLNHQLREGRDAGVSVVACINHLALTLKALSGSG